MRLAVNSSSARWGGGFMLCRCSRRVGRFGDGWVFGGKIGSEAAASPTSKQPLPDGRASEGHCRGSEAMPLASPF